MEPASAEAIADLQAVGLQLRALISSLKATPERAATVGAAAANLITELPELAAEATVSAQLELNNPLASAAAKSEAQRTIERVQGVVQELIVQAADIQQQVVALPARSQQLVARAQQLLMGAALAPPKSDTPGPVITTLAATMPRKKDPAPAAAAPNTPPQAETEPYQWGWWVASGLSAAVMGTGIVVFVTANDNVRSCEAAASGCSNYYELRDDQVVGVALLSSGATGTVAMSLTALIVNSPSPTEGANVVCSPLLGGLACSGRF